jgi:hypothetical protein
MVQENREAFADSPIKDLQKPQIETYFSELYIPCSMFYPSAPILSSQGLVVELALISVKDLVDWAKPIAVEVGTGRSRGNLLSILLPRAPS